MSHEKIEKNTGLMAILIVIAVSFGGLAEIVPLFFIAETTEPVDGLKPYPALQLEGRDVYIREGCNTCHTQMVRPMRAETERYGHYNVAGEDVYEYPHLWGSKRTGPDLSRIGGRYSDDWHRVHLINPRDVVPESNMPAFGWLEENVLDGKYTATKMSRLRMLGVPYTDSDIEGAKAAVEGKTELDAVVAYLQGLGLEMKNK